MSKNIDGILENWVLPSIIDFNPKYKLILSETDRKIYQFTLDNNQALILDILYSAQNGVEFIPRNENIPLDKLSLIFLKINPILNQRRKEIQSYFEIQMQEKIDN